MTENPERIAEELDRPWETLEAMFQQAEPPDEAVVEAFLQRLPPCEAVRTVSRLADDDQARLLGCLSPGEAADLLAQLPEPEAVHAIEQLAPEAAATIVDQLPSNEQADLISHLDQRDAEAILVAMPADRASNVRRLAEYPEDRAGGLMVTEFVAYPLQTTAAEVIADLRPGRSLSQVRRSVRLCHRRRGSLGRRTEAPRPAVGRGGSSGHTDDGPRSVRGAGRRGPGPASRLL